MEKNPCLQNWRTALRAYLKNRKCPSLVAAGVPPAATFFRDALRLALLILAGGNALAQSASAPSVTKDVLLRNIVRDVIVPGYQELAAKSHALTVALEDFGKAPSQDSLEQARKAWVAALLASRQIQWLQTGPIADREYIASFCYAKVLPARMDEVLSSSRAIDDSYLGELGATAKGMFALEYLLFGRRANPAAATNAAPASVLELFTRAEAPRRRQYVLALARDLEAKARQLAQDWTASGDQSAAAKFVAGGQDSLNRVVNHLAQLIEQVAEQRLNFVLQLQPPVSRQFDRIEGSPSGTSSQSAAALLQGAQKLYRGAAGEGLEAYLKHLNAPLAERSQGMFETAIAAVQATGAPLEDVVPDNRATVDNAYQKTRALEVLCKTDLASALGVTITFTSGDGD
jgi:predicted lipoprotein